MTPAITFLSWTRPFPKPTANPLAGGPARFRASPREGGLAQISAFSGGISHTRPCFPVLAFKKVPLRQIFFDLGGSSLSPRLASSFFHSANRTPLPALLCCTQDPDPCPLQPGTRRAFLWAAPGSFPPLTFCLGKSDRIRFVSLHPLPRVQRRD